MMIICSLAYIEILRNIYRKVKFEMHFNMKFLGTTDSEFNLNLLLHKNIKTNKPQASQRG